MPVLTAWHERGYSVLVQLDPGCSLPVPHVEREYRGYAEAVNHLTRIALVAGAEWIVTGGDDVWPDPSRTAEEIAEQCEEHFKSFAARIQNNGTFGVMQPTGDRWGEHADAHEFAGMGAACSRCGRGRDCDQHLMGAYIDRVAGSPWIGAEFARRINGGNGPLWHQYFHMFEDQELMEVAQRLGVFWQRPDLVHHHQHWGRPKPGQKIGHAADMPKFLEKANSGELWRQSRELFERRRAAGFPGSEPIA